MNASDVDLDPVGGFRPSQSLPVAWSDTAQWMQCGKQGFTALCVNIVALTALATSVAINSAWLAAGAGLVILPSMVLFGPKDYCRFVPQPLRMGLGFAIAFFDTKVDKNTGAWSGSCTDWAHFYDGRLSRALIDFFGNEEASSIIDFGCGTGAYVQDMTKETFVVKGYDLNPSTAKIPNCQVLDVATPSLDVGQVDWVLSLETGEHIPKINEETNVDQETAFLDNLVRHARNGIVLSWAKKGQGGLGHVNEQNNDYIEQKMFERGWVRDVAAEKGLRLSTSPHCFWFYDTIMVYRPANPNS